LKPVRTNIAGLDEFLMGGLPPKIILLTGQPGSGNEVFARQVLFNKAKATPVTYFTVNSSTESIREDMATYGWDTLQFEKNGNWKYVNLRNLEANTWEELVLNEIKQNRIVVIDSISELLLVCKIEKLVDLLIALENQNIKSQNFHLLLLTEGMQDPQSETIMNHFAEGSISFVLNWAADSIIRQLIIRKLSGTVVPTRRLTYTLGKRGFIIETATRIS
jgi:KaiC/GvpD/RAD55 family RecA-like ATPase